MKQGIAALAIGLLTSCAPAVDIARFGGATMGTTYQVAYLRGDPPAGDPAREVEELLADINRSMSTYMETSLISTINMSMDTDSWHPVDAHFAAVFRRSREIHKDTGGAFNPAVGPLVNAWGFGPRGFESVPDEASIRRLLEVASFDAFEFRESPPSVRKAKAEARLDFGAVAKGYAVDAIGGVLGRRGVTSYLVEIGGEVRARGRRPDGRGWRVGIEKPAAAAAAPREIHTVIDIRDSALATSGNYRNFEIRDGRRLSHILDPKTGHPEQSSLLSVSVLATDTMTADAYATALMVMGLEEGLAFVEARPDLAALFLASGADGRLIERRSAQFPASGNRR